MSTFETLNQISVSDHIEHKGSLSYLSWAWAWQELKKVYPNANSKVYETPEGCIYWTDGRTAWVKTGVTIDGLEHIEYLPVMDNRNRSIPLDKITSMDVNTAIQRSITKAIARHGLGLYIYAGEDLPEAEQSKTQEENAEKAKLRIEAKINTISAACTARKTTARPNGYKPEDITCGRPLDDLSEDELDAVIDALHQKKWIA